MRAEVDDLTKANRHVDEARRIVWEQKGRITRLRTAGVDTVEAERTLRLLEANLLTFDEHKRALEREQQGLPPRLIAAE
jgi:hypothetical protein